MRPTNYTPEERAALMAAAPALDHSKPNNVRNAAALAEAALPAKERKRLSAARCRLRDSHNALTHAETSGNADWIARARSMVAQRQDTLARVMRELGIAPGSDSPPQDRELRWASMQHDSPEACATADILTDSGEIVGFRD